MSSAVFMELALVVQAYFGVGFGFLSIRLLELVASFFLTPPVGKLVSVHHPFTAPLPGYEHFLTSDPCKVPLVGSVNL